MATITPAAAAKFKEIFKGIGYDNAAIRLGTRPKEPDSTEHYIDFIPDTQVDMLNNMVQITNGVMLVIRRSDEEVFNKTVIDYIEEPRGFIFGTSTDA